MTGEARSCRKEWDKQIDGKMLDLLVSTLRAGELIRKKDREGKGCGVVQYHKDATCSGC